MRYASVCDGIGAAHVAWQPLGWECAWTSEIEPFPAAVVDHHWKLKNVGDMTKLTEEQLHHEGPISLLVGGTPCQSFSVAGLRKGLEDPRGNLALRFTQLVGVLRPTWVVWENVPGVLSSAGGRDFGTFLGALAELGYGFAYRVLDAQWFGVAQRRRRVLLVGHARDWRRAAAVLFERESVFGDSPTRGAERERVTSPIAGCSNGGGANGPGRTADDADSLVPVISPALKARDYKGPSSDVEGVAIQGMAVRRLTPRECERLQGFPDDYTAVTYRNKPAADGPRYKALGNSMAVPVMRWIGQRIAEVDSVSGDNA